MMLRKSSQMQVVILGQKKTPQAYSKFKSQALILIHKRSRAFITTERFRETKWYILNKNKTSIHLLIITPLNFLDRIFTQPP